MFQLSTAAAVCAVVDVTGPGQQALLVKTQWACSGTTPHTFRFSGMPYSSCSSRCCASRGAAAAAAASVRPSRLASCASTYFSLPPSAAVSLDCTRLATREPHPGRQTLSFPVDLRAGLQARAGGGAHISGSSASTSFTFSFTYASISSLSPRLTASACATGRQKERIVGLAFRAPSIRLTSAPSSPPALLSNVSALRPCKPLCA